MDRFSRIIPVENTTENPVCSTNNINIGLKEGKSFAAMKQSSTHYERLKLIH